MNKITNYKEIKEEALENNLELEFKPIIFMNGADAERFEDEFKQFLDTRDYGLFWCPKLRNKN